MLEGLEKRKEESTSDPVFFFACTIKLANFSVSYEQKIVAILVFLADMTLLSYFLFSLCLALLRVPLLGLR